MNKRLSIIIITLNEAEHIGRLLHHLIVLVEGEERVEVLLVDGGSDDDTCAIATAMGVRVLRCPHSGRAVQMNYGAQHSSGEILYFVHADSLPPNGFLEDIRMAVLDGYPIGCFRFRFDSKKLLLCVNSYFTRFDRMWCRGGDQTLFITRALFDELGGYDESFLIMEEYDLMARARKKASFKIIPKDVLVSARKYAHNGYLKVQLANFVVFNMYRFGVKQERMRRWYKRMLGGR